MIINLEAIGFATSMMMRYASLGVAALLAVTLTGCFSPSEEIGEQAAERMLEKAIENGSDGKAKVDIDDGGATINTGEGSMQVGENVSIPTDFPADVYVYEGKVISVIKSNEQNGYSVTIQSDDPVATIRAAYEEKMKSDGWVSTASMDLGSAVTMAGEKDGRVLSVMIGGEDGEAKSIVVNVMDKE